LGLFIPVRLASRTLKETSMREKVALELDTEAIRAAEAAGLIRRSGKS